MGKLTDREKQLIVQDYLGGQSAYRLARLYNVGETSIRSILRVRGVQIRSKRRYSVNESYFDVIDSEEKAYWLGFLFADGNVYKSTVALKLATKDVDHIRKFTSALQSQHPIKRATDRDAYVVKIGSEKLSSSLISRGVMPKKSLIVTFPTFLDEQGKRHFIRGVFDGDGWITYYKPKDMVRPSWTLGFFSGSQSFLADIQEVIGLGGSLHPYRKGHQLSYGGNLLVPKVCDYLYGGSSVYLPRKYGKYAQLQTQLKDALTPRAK